MREGKDGRSHTVGVTFQYDAVPSSSSLPPSQHENIHQHHHQYHHRQRQQQQQKRRHPKGPSFPKLAQDNVSYKETLHHSKTTHASSLFTTSSSNNYNNQIGGGNNFQSNHHIPNHHSQQKQLNRNAQTLYNKIQRSHHLHKLSSMYSSKINFFCFLLPTSIGTAGSGFASLITLAYFYDRPSGMDTTQRTIHFTIVGIVLLCTTFWNALFVHYVQSKQKAVVHGHIAKELHKLSQRLFRAHEGNMNMDLQHPNKRKDKIWTQHEINMFQQLYDQIIHSSASSSTWYTIPNCLTQIFKDTDLRIQTLFVSELQPSSPPDFCSKNNDNGNNYNNEKKEQHNNLLQWWLLPTLYKTLTQTIQDDTKSLFFFLFLWYAPQWYVETALNVVLQNYSQLLKEENGGKKKRKREEKQRRKIAALYHAKKRQNGYSSPQRQQRYATSRELLEHNLPDNEEESRISNRHIEEHDYLYDEEEVRNQMNTRQLSMTLEEGLYSLQEEDEEEIPTPSVGVTTTTTATTIMTSTTTTSITTATTTNVPSPPSVTFDQNNSDTGGVGDVSSKKEHEQQQWNGWKYKQETSPSSSSSSTNGNSSRKEEENKSFHPLQKQNVTSSSSSSSSHSYFTYEDEEGGDPTMSYFQSSLSLLQQISNGNDSGSYNNNDSSAMIIHTNQEGVGSYVSTLSSESKSTMCQTSASSESDLTSKGSLQFKNIAETCRILSGIVEQRLLSKRAYTDDDVECLTTQNDDVPPLSSERTTPAIQNKTSEINQFDFESVPMPSSPIFKADHMEYLAHEKEEPDIFFFSNEMTTPIIQNKKRSKINQSDYNPDLIPSSPSLDNIEHLVANEEDNGVNETFSNKMTTPNIRNKNVLNINTSDCNSVPMPSVSPNNDDDADMASSSPLTISTPLPTGHTKHVDSTTIKNITKYKRGEDKENEQQNCNGKGGLYNLYIPNVAQPREKQNAMPFVMSSNNDTNNSDGINMAQKMPSPSTSSSSPSRPSINTISNNSNELNTSDPSLISFDEDSGSDDEEEEDINATSSDSDEDDDDPRIGNYAAATGGGFPLSHSSSGMRKVSHRHRRASPSHPSLSYPATSKLVKRLSTIESSGSIDEKSVFSDSENDASI